MPTAYVVAPGVVIRRHICVIALAPDRIEDMVGAAGGQLDDSRYDGFGIGSVHRMSCAKALNC